MQCSSCQAPLPDGGRFCPTCGTPSRTAASSGDDPTRTSAESADTSGAAFAPPSDGARFPPGTVLADRYRIIGLLGRGGMGEVYRADDLKLGRPVALKFLPEAMEHEPGRLARLLNEVRTALSVTHPNVCRVHDIGETGGRHFLSMEYVDGEDLATLLRRVGHLPEDRATQVARQLCAGLAAAHSRGVLHRDLKPANVMIDGRGEVKITDFGLAGAIGGFEGREIRVGTPAYMSPEQVAGREVTVRSDIYALGLVLYELFSGKPAFAGRTPEEIQHRHETTPTSLSSIVDGLNPSVSRIIERCLSADPVDRPGSALAVSAALPGGDPLAAALAAGETPSPELVAEAGASAGLRTRMAVLCLIGIALGGIFSAMFTSKLTLASRVGLDRSPAVLADRGAEIIRDAGYGENVRDSLYSWEPNWGYYHRLRASGLSGERWEALSQPRPAGMLFLYRSSPFPLYRTNNGAIGNWMGDPNPFAAGMAEVWLDPEGRLEAFAATPVYSEVIETSPHPAGAEVEWSPFFEAAGLDAAAFTEAESEIRPRSHSDRRYAWDGHYPDVRDVAVRIEAASTRGRPILFTVIESWDRPVAGGKQDSKSFWERAADITESAWFVVAVIGASLVAFRNVRLGRGDHRTALRFGLYLGAVRLLWMLAAEHHASAIEIDVVRGHLAWSAYRVALSYVFYLALEPYARRLWPEMLVSWVRVFGGRFSDPRVGRDVLIGLAFGVAVALCNAALMITPELLEIPGYGLRSEMWSWEGLRGPGSAVASLAGFHTGSVINGLIGFMGFLVVRIVTRSTSGSIVLITLFAAAMFNPGSGSAWPYLLSIVLTLGLFWVVLFRAGLLSIMIGFTVNDWLSQIRVTADLAAWHALPMWLSLGAVAALTIWGFRAATAGRPLFRDEIIEG